MSKNIYDYVTDFAFWDIKASSKHDKYYVSVPVTIGEDTINVTGTLTRLQMEGIADGTMALNFTARVVDNPERMEFREKHGVSKLFIDDVFKCKTESDIKELMVIHPELFLFKTNAEEIFNELIKRTLQFLQDNNLDAYTEYLRTLKCTDKEVGEWRGR